MREFAESQQEELIRALSGHGQFRLCSAVSHYEVTMQVWVKMMAEQQQDVVATFENAMLPNAHSVEQGSKSIASSSLTEVVLSVSAKDSGITSIPLVTLTSMWNKASELLSISNGITAAPGSDTKARMVLSRSQVVLHHVQSCSHGRYLCDKNCPQWISSQICSHTLAIAEQNEELFQFLQWYVASGQGPYFTSIGLSGLPKGRGQKGGRPKQKRARPFTPGPDNYTFWPGLASPLSESYAESDRPCSSTGLMSQFQPVLVSFSAQVLPGQFQHEENIPIQQSHVCQNIQKCQAVHQTQVCQPSLQQHLLMSQLFLLLLDPHL